MVIILREVVPFDFETSGRHSGRVVFIMREVVISDFVASGLLAPTLYSFQRAIPG